MPRYIDADVTLETLKEFLIKTAINNVGYKRDVDEVCKDIADNRLSVWMEYVPSADVVEVVRCKDCKYHGATIEEQPTPSIMCAHMHDNDYCSYGERREDARNGNP